MSIPASTFRFQTTLVVSLTLLCSLLIFPACKPLQVNTVSDRLVPSNDRIWTADMRKLSVAEFNDKEVTIRNIRNCEYLTESDYVVEYYDRTINLDDIQSVDFIVVPFKNAAIAHTMLSFGLRDGTYLCISVEIRIELGEGYSTILGMSNQFELIYQVADERDLIRLRTRHRDAKVYVYPTIATPEASRDLFVDVFQRVNKLAVRPEFYNTLTNNCTTNIVSHVNDLKTNRVPFGWKVLLPGYSAQYAYELGLLDNRLPFEELTQLALVNNLVDEHFYDPNFSQLIRSKHKDIERLIELSQESAAKLRLEEQGSQQRTSQLSAQRNLGQRQIRNTNRR